jgi:hypothetical protein
MAGTAVRESVTLAGRAERARIARAFVDGVLGPGHPCGDVAVLLADELFGNSVRYRWPESMSGSPQSGQRLRCLPSRFAVALSSGEPRLARRYRQ